LVSIPDLNVVGRRLSYNRESHPCAAPQSPLRQIHQLKIFTYPVRTLPPGGFSLRFRANPVEYAFV
jgi:hypothetical protein